MQRTTAIGGALALVLAARTASAEELRIVSETSLPRVDATGNQLPKRGPSANPERVSGQDCVDDQRIRFTLLLSGYEANAHIEVWASSSGQDCADAMSRTGSTRSCWPVIATQVPLQPESNVDVPVRSILSGAAPFAPAAPDATTNVCGKVPLSQLAVHFMYFEPGNLSRASIDHAVAVEVDTINPPEAPGGAASGDGGANADRSDDSDGGCRMSHASPFGVPFGLGGLAVAALVRRRRR